MGSIVIKEQATPATPATDYHTVFVDSADGVLKKKNDAGAVSSLEPPVASVFGRTGAVTAQNGDYTPAQVGADPSGTASAAIATHVGLSDPHTQYALDSDLTAKEDVANKSTDGTLAANSDTLYPSQKAVRTYVLANAGASPLTTKGDLYTFDTGNQRLPVGANGKVLSANSAEATGLEWVDQFTFTGTADRALRTDASGDLETLNNIEVFSNGFSDSDFAAISTGLTQSNDIIRNNITLTATVDSPDEGFVLYSNQANVDATFDLGTNGQFFRFHVNNIVVDNDKDVGHVEFIQNNFSIGNGTDPIESDGISYMMGFGTVNSGVTIKGPIQGYGYQMNIQAGATFDPATYSQGFYDAANFNVDMPGHTSFNAGPNIDTITTGHNYQGFTSNPNIDTIETGAGVTIFNAGGTFGTFEGSSYWQGLNVNPTITSSRYAVGVNVSMDSVTLYAGVAASLVIQDLTITADTPGSFQNSFTVEYTSGGTAGAEVVTIVGPAISVQIDSGVSTATQVAAALNGNVSFASNATAVVTGTGSNPQVTQAATNLSGGEDAGRKQAAYLDGDVEITGSLTFGGALSIGQLSAFASLALYDTGGNPSSVHGLITNPTVAANATLTTADHIAINTAMLLNIGDNASVSTAFVGISALGLPAVVTMGTGSTVDQVSGAIFAVSLDATATGGTIDRLDLCRSVAIPNGVTAINNLRGYKFDLPFGDPGTNTWGFYEAPGSHNFFEGDLKIGAGSDIADSGYKLHVEGGGFLVEDTATLLNAVGSEIGFFGATPVVQQTSSGAVTAGGTYTATEQAMIQEMYTAMRAYGLLT